MARPTLNDTEKKGERLTVRFCSDEMKELTNQAEISALSVSELVRRRVLGKRVAAATDLKMLSELRRIGGLIKHIFNESNGLHQKKTFAILNELHAAIIRIGQQQQRKEE